MKLKLIAVTAILAAQPIAPAQAEFYTGNDLYSNCTAEKSDAVYYQKFAICMGYVSGSVDTFVFMQRLFKGPTCLSEQVTSGQMTDVVIKFLRDHPERRARAGSAIVTEALIDGFGCKLMPKD